MPGVWNIAFPMARAARQSGRRRKPQTGVLNPARFLESFTMHNDIESDLVYFFHIPKTSGTSLCQSFRQMCGPEAVCLLWDDLVNGTYQMSNQHRLIAGHFGGFLPLWLKRWPKIVTILRNPLARALSHINHIQRDSQHPLHSYSVGLTVGQYCEHPILRKTVDNFQSRYLASLDFAMALVPRTREPREPEPYGSVSVRFENALYSLDKESGLLDGALRAISAIDLVGICEAHGSSLQVFARALGWQADVVEFGLNQANSGQWTLKDLSRTEIEVLATLNHIDAQVYDHAVDRFLHSCRDHNVELSASERFAASPRGVPHEVALSANPPGASLGWSPGPLGSSTWPDSSGSVAFGNSPAV
jgi:hypothetical protein